MGKNFGELIQDINRKFSSLQEYEKAVSDNLFRDLQNNIKTASIAQKAIAGGFSINKGTNRIKISSLDDLFAFNRVSSDTLVHKSTKDLWAIDSDEDGSVRISRLFDESGEPLKV